MDAWQRLIRQREGRGQEGAGVAVETWSWALACKRDLRQIVQKTQSRPIRGGCEKFKDFSGGWKSCCYADNLREDSSL